MALDQNDKEFIVDAINTAVSASEDRLKAYVDGSIDTSEGRLKAYVDGSIRNVVFESERRMADLMNAKFDELYKFLGDSYANGLVTEDTYDTLEKRVDSIEAKLVSLKR